MKQKDSLRVKNLAIDGMMAAVLFVVGLFKLPSFLPGTEFQLSAPYAVAIAKTRGFVRYLLIGIAASAVGLCLGMQNIYNVITAMVYRVVAGAVVALFPNSKAAVAVSGPCGSVASRVVLGLLLQTDVRALLLFAAPGMVFTAVTAPMMTKLMEKLLEQFSTSRTAAN
ncbi:hypothetical protein D1646_11385 [Pseudoflavonifractor sp. 60]|uniref:hypothetical protein n=1 Tax=Pseudoflavonifractor sp. 60 TaxID=2304576 RepID=UPI00136D5B8F|nr:hypothetical protein [Pseudoflavonifractor sp. 60]NBI67401.1 hypothetical protein [Pseudoflavonifractor sp. 60]